MKAKTMFTLPTDESELENQIVKKLSGEYQRVSRLFPSTAPVCEGIGIHYVNKH